MSWRRRTGYQLRHGRSPTTRIMTGINTATYRVTLPVFEGPLDLLLYLIERQELDITHVSLAQVTNQYLDYLSQARERDPDNLADFLVVAAKLLLIKSRVLLPQSPSPPSPEEDVGDDLVQQLMEYKRFKEASRWLKDIEGQGLRSYVRLAAAPPLERSLDLGDVTLDNLLAAIRQVLAVKPPGPSIDNAVLPITITIADQMDLIERETDQGRSASFLRLLEQATNRIEVVVTL